MKMFRCEGSLSLSLSLCLSSLGSLSLSPPQRGGGGCCMIEGCCSALAFAIVLLLFFVTALAGSSDCSWAARMRFFLTPSEVPGPSHRSFLRTFASP